jgi:hypothetical protein
MKTSKLSPAIATRLDREVKFTTQAGSLPSCVFLAYQGARAGQGSLNTQALQSGDNEEKREAGGQGEFSVGLAARRDVASQPAT